MRPGSTRAGRTIAGIALSACLLTQLAGMVHLATVRHVACAEHGGVVELASMQVRRQEPARGTALVTAGEAEQHHQHCALAATPSFAGTDAAPQGSCSHIVRTTAMLVETGHPPVIALLHLAPKSSPPV